MNQRTTERRRGGTRRPSRSRLAAACKDRIIHDGVISSLQRADGHQDHILVPISNNSGQATADVLLPSARAEGEQRGAGDTSAGGRTFGGTAFEELPLCRRGKASRKRPDRTLKSQETVSESCHSNCKVENVRNYVTAECAGLRCLSVQPPPCPWPAESERP